MSGKEFEVESEQCEVDPFFNFGECLNEEWIERAKELLGEIQEQRFWYF